jgi:predicted ribosomally synthesized peptide with SipW-like signal peptide
VFLVSITNLHIHITVTIMFSSLTVGIVVACVRALLSQVVRPFLSSIFRKVVKNNMKNLLKSVVMLVAVGAVMANATLAAFTAQAVVTGNTFSTGSASLLLYKDLAGDAVEDNLSQTLDNTVDFSNIVPGWTQDYVAKVFNAGTVPLNLTVNTLPTVSNTALQNEIKVEVFLWDDSNGDGVVDDGELGASVGGPMTMLAWQGLAPTGIPVNSNFGVGETQGVVFRFTTWNLINDADETDELQGETMTYDFIFDGTTDGVSP